jgi:hypothetical protein
MTVRTSAVALPLFLTCRLREFAVRVALETTIFVAVLCSKLVHHGLPCRVVLEPTWSEADVTSLEGIAVAFAVALNMNWGFEELPVLTMKALMSKTAALDWELFTCALFSRWAVKVVVATAAA